MKKKNLLLMLVFLLGLTSCGFYSFQDGSIPEGDSENNNSEVESDETESEGSEIEPSEPDVSEPETSEPDVSEPDVSEGEGSEDEPYTPPTLPTENEDFDGYYRLNDNKLVYDELGEAAPHTGDAKMLVIPLSFSSGTTQMSYRVETWDNTKIQKVNDYFFGEKEDTPNSWNSLKTYFESTSLNAIKVSGIVTDVFDVKSFNNNYTVKYICDNDDPSLTMLQSIFKAAVSWVKTNHSDINWSEYDRNDDGYFDNLHFISNLTKTATLQGDYSPFWPHKWQINDAGKGNLNSPNGYLYESTALGHFENAETIIHEQSHVFGIQDYYDYTYSGADYLGYCDMQSANIFSWNSFSKFCVGWSRPYVVDGSKDSTTVTINSAELTNECLIIPANHDTFNGSAFDEYILIELFTKDGNNVGHWNEYFGSSFNYGVRLYHVDARLISYYYETPIEDDLSRAKELADLGDYVDVGCNNSYNYEDYNGVYKSWADFKLLTLLQKGKIDTFGEADAETIGEPAAEDYDYLSKNDLFYTGDVFDINDYYHFFSKTGKTVNKMDNGETFPYIIKFDSVSKSSATITVTKK